MNYKPECGICLHPKDVWFSMPCGHVVCQGCQRALVENSSPNEPLKCHLCREPFTADQFKRIFLPNSERSGPRRTRVEQPTNSAQQNQDELISTACQAISSLSLGNQREQIPGGTNVSARRRSPQARSQSGAASSEEGNHTYSPNVQQDGALVNFAASTNISTATKRRPGTNNRGGSSPIASPVVISRTNSRTSTGEGVIGWKLSPKPVATPDAELPTCLDGERHQWRALKGSNNVRRYECTRCDFPIVKESKVSEVFLVDGMEFVEWASHDA